ncbi:MAG: hypothetical protein KC416_09670, partial [Myxococcales bacterium]|nr:hypothetical protein [Myxococcales bacterium]
MGLHGFRGRVLLGTTVLLTACGSPHAPVVGAETAGQTGVSASAPCTVVPTHLGPGVFEVGPDGATFWARAQGKSVMHVRVGDTKGRMVFHRTASAAEVDDFNGATVLEGLAPGTTYRYRVSFAKEADCMPSPEAGVAGTFRTAPAVEDARAVTFAWSGDVGGQNICRDAEEGYPIARAIVAAKPDFFVALGDMIYADYPCSARGLLGNDQVEGDFGPAVDLE